MLKSKISNLTKQEITKKIHLKTGFSIQYTKKIIDDIIFILKNLIKEKKLNIKNLGTFKIIDKKERIGRNPKNKRMSIISARKSISFTASKKFRIEDNDC